MPQSRNRPGHQYQKPSAIPPGQRAHATTICAILFAVFAGIFAYSASASYAVLALVVVAGAIVGYFIGKAMERDAKSKT